MGVQAILGQYPNIIDYIKYIENKTENDFTKKRDIVIIIGSNQGLCGRFNDKVSEFYLENSTNDKNEYIITVGDRIGMLLTAQHIKFDKHFSTPNSINAIIKLVYELFNIIEAFLKKNMLRKVVIYYTTYSSGDAGNLIKSKILPLDRKYFRKLNSKKWPTNNIPFWRTDIKVLMSDLVQQYIFTNIYLTIVNSMAAEQKNRLMTLQGTEENIREHIIENNLKYNQMRQNIITSELIDVVGGSRFLKKRRR